MLKKVIIKKLTFNLEVQNKTDLTKMYDDYNNLSIFQNIILKKKITFKAWNCISKYIVPPTLQVACYTNYQKRNS